MRNVDADVAAKTGPGRPVRGSAIAPGAADVGWRLDRSERELQELGVPRRAARRRFANVVLAFGQKPEPE